MVESWLVVICFLTTVDQASILFLFQFLPKLVAQVVDESNVGLYIGILVTLGFVAQVSSCFVFAKVSSKVGRKPLMILSQFGTIPTILMFGLSKSFALLLIFHVIGSIFAFHLPIALAYIGENTNKNNQAHYFNYHAISTVICEILGASVGGLLSTPSHQYPHIFSETSIWGRYPNFMSCFVIAVFKCIAGIVALVSLVESQGFMLRHSRSIRNDGNEGERENERCNLITDSDDKPLQKRSETEAAPPSPISFRELIRYPSIIYANLTLAVAKGMYWSFEVVTPIYFQSERSQDGLGFLPYQTGMVGVFVSFTSLVYRIFLSSRLLDRFSLRELYRVSSVYYMILFCIFPLCSYMYGIELWIYMMVLVISRQLALIFFGTSAIVFVRNSAPEGTIEDVFALANASSSLFQIICAFVTCALWSIASKFHFLYHQSLPYLFLSMLSTAAFLLVSQIPQSLDKQQHQHNDN